MKKAVLLGTSHPIQRGVSKKDSFQKYIEQLCSTHCINAVAEEIDIKSTVASGVSDKIDITHIIIEPTPEESKKLGIEEVHRIVYELMNKYEIENWPIEPSTYNLPLLVYEEYTSRIQATYRQRESEWLRRIEELNTWPILIICGANHFQPFFKLLSSSGIDVTKEENKWGL